VSSDCVGSYHGSPGWFKSACLHGARDPGVVELETEVAQRLLASQIPARSRTSRSTPRHGS